MLLAALVSPSYPPMARITNLARKTREAEKAKASYIRDFGLLLLMDAENLTEEFTALSFLLFARQKQRSLRSGRYGRRGPYDRPKVEELLDNILYDTTPRFFKSFMQYANASFGHILTV